MQDHFLEEVVIKQKNGVNRALYLLSWVIIVLTGFFAVISFSSITSSLYSGGFSWPEAVPRLITA